MSAVVEEIGTEIVEFNEFEALLDQLEKDYGTRVYDLTDTDQEAAARSDRMKVAKTQTAFKKVRLAAKEDAQAVVNNVNTKGKAIDDRMEAVKQNIKGQIDKRDQEVAEHAEMLAQKVDEIYMLGTFDENYSVCASDYEERLTAVRRIDVDESYEDRQADATLAQVNTIKKLESLLETSRKQEAEAAELERLRKDKEDRDREIREEQIRKEAAEKATREAEADAKAAIEAAEKRERDAAQEAQNKIDEAQRKQEEAEIAERNAEEAAKQKLLREQEVKAAQDKIEQEKREKLKADEAHRETIRSQAIASMVDNGSSPEAAVTVIETIAAGKIKHISINY